MRGSRIAREIEEDLKREKKLLMKKAKERYKKKVGEVNGK